MLQKLQALLQGYGIKYQQARGAAVSCVLLAADHRGQQMQRQNGNGTNGMANQLTYS